MTKKLEKHHQCVWHIAIYSCHVERGTLVHKAGKIPFIHTHSVVIAIRLFLHKQKDWQSVPTMGHLAPCEKHPSVLVDWERKAACITLWSKIRLIPDN